MSKSNMYDWITGTKNFIRGACEHKCAYCYVKKSRVKKLYEGPPKLIESQFKSLGKGNFWFIGSMIDMFAEGISEDWIYKTLEYCQEFQNKYLFQSKNPNRMRDFFMHFPSDTVIGTTIETNREYSEMGKAPPTIKRVLALRELSNDFPVMVTIEPIMDFDTFDLVHIIRMCDPEWVNVGADSQNSGLPEPSADKVKELIRILKMSGVKVKIKDNLKRLCPDAESEE